MAFFLHIFGELFTILTIAVLWVHSQENSGGDVKNCLLVHRQTTLLLDNAEIGTSRHNRHHRELEDIINVPTLCPATMHNSSCCTPSVQYRLMTERTPADLTEWMLQTANLRMVSALNESLTQLRNALRSHLSRSELLLHQMFEEQFPLAAIPTRPVINKFFKSIFDILMNSSMEVDDSFDEDMHQIVATFFSELFPPVYACYWLEKCHERGYAVPSNYSSCMSEYFDRIEPFNDIPSRLAINLILASKSLAVGFRFLSELSSFIDLQHKSQWFHVWRWTSSDDRTLDLCKLSIFQLQYCPLCSGRSQSNVQPCKDACQATVQLCIEQQKKFNGPLFRIDNNLNTAWRLLEHRLRTTSSPTHRQSLVLEDLLDGVRFDIDNLITSRFFAGASTISEKVVDFCGPIQSAADEVARNNGRHEKKRVLKKQQTSDDKMQIRSTNSDRHLPVLSMMLSIAQNFTATFSGYYGQKRLAEMMCSNRPFSNSRSECWSPSRHMQTMSIMDSAQAAQLDSAKAAVVRSSDSRGTQMQDGQQIELEARLKRITDTLQKARGPDFDVAENNGQSERLVAADRPPSYQANAGQQQFMVRNDEIMSSGDGAMEDDEDDDGNGEFGSGDAPEDLEPEVLSGLGRGTPTRVTEGIYVEDADTTRKPIVTTTLRQARPPYAGTTKKAYVESEHRHPTTPKSRAGSTASTCRTVSFISLWPRLLVSLLVSLLLCRRNAVSYFDRFSILST